MRLVAAIILLTLLPLTAAFGQSGGAVTVRLDVRLPGSEKAVGLACHLVTEDPNVVYTRVQAENPGISQAGLIRAWRAATLAGRVAGNGLDRELKASFDGLTAGPYWVVTLEPTASGGLNLFWAEPVRVEAGLTAQARLTLSNAALVLDTADCHLN